MHDSDCLVPTLGVTWHQFLPVVYLPLWQVAASAPNAPFTTITAGNWGTIMYRGRELSLGKRDAYREFIELPTRTKLLFELAADIHAEREANDLELLRCHQWRVVDPYKVAGSPSAFRNISLVLGQKFVVQNQSTVR
jgi:hypothetical protein